MHPETDTPSDPSVTLSQPRLPTLRRFSLAAPVIASCLLWASPIWAQAVAPAQPAEPAAEEPPVELSPFLVSSEKGSGYQATSTLAGTRLSTELKDIGAAVSVYTQDFLEDISVSKLEDILGYTMSTEGSGIRGNFSGVVGENSSEARDDPAANNRVRALAQATRTRDFFASDIPGDTYNFGALTISRGPNAILAGVGNAGGVMDSAMNKAGFKDSYRVVSRFGSYDSHREELHMNKVLIPQRLALRLDLLSDEKGYRQDPAYDSDKRLYTALQYRVFEPKRGGILGRGTFRANYEDGKIEGVPPDPLTPTFTVGQWFNATTPKYQWWGYGAPLVGAPTAANAATLSPLRNSSGVGVVPAGSGVIQGFPLYAQMALVYANPTSSAAGLGISNPALSDIQGFQGSIPVTLPGGTGGSVRSTGDANRLRAGYVRTRLSDPNIFNFYDELMTGAFDTREQTFRAMDFRYEQLLLDGKAGIEIAYNDQTFTRRRDFSIPTGGNDEGILVDVNYYLSVKDNAGQPILNPNFGRPFISSTDVFRDQTNRTDRESTQLTAFFKHDFTTSDSKWVKLLGRHTVSALLFNTKIDRFNRTYSSTWDPTASPTPQASLNGAAVGTFGTQVNGWFYLGPSLLNLASVDQVRLQPITAARPKYGQSYMVRVYNPATRSFVTSQQTPQRILQRLVDQREELNSTAFALQSNFFKNHIITVVGWREDNDDAFSSLSPLRLANGNLDDSTVTFLPAVTQVERSWTKSVVGRLPVPLPADTEVRVFWNTSGNFNPVGQRRNIWNEELGSPTADTKEYGVSISTFRGRLDLRVNRFRTQIKDDSIGGVGNPYNYISAMIGRLIGARDAGLSPANFNYIHPDFKTFSDVALALYDTLPDRFKANIGADKNFNPRFTGSGSTLTWNPESIVNLASTSDTQSTGSEFEAIINPTRNWRVSMSVARNDAVKANAAAEELAFAEAWKRNLDTKYNGALLPGSRNPSANELGTFYAQYVAEALPSIRAAAARSGVSSPEIRKWRANLVTRYDFRTGFLRGVNIGGAVRWQDKIGIGYPFVTNATGESVADVTRPYWGPRDTAFDVSVGYTRKLKIFGSPVNWTLGVNVRNLNAKDELIPIAANPDGSWGTFRIAPDRTWTVSNALAF